MKNVNFKNLIIASILAIILCFVGVFNIFSISADTTITPQKFTFKDELYLPSNYPQQHADLEFYIVNDVTFTVPKSEFFGGEFYGIYIEIDAETWGMYYITTDDEQIYVYGGEWQEEAWTLIFSDTAVFASTSGLEIQSFFDLNEHVEITTYNYDFDFVGNGGTFANASTSITTDLLTSEKATITYSQYQLNLLLSEKPTRNGYNFYAWSLSPNTAIENVQSSFTLDVSTGTTYTFYAIWEEIETPKYTAQLNYFANGGRIGENSTSSFTGYLYNLEANTLTLTQADVNNVFFNSTEPDLRNDFIFKGWGLEENSTEAFSNVTMTANSNGQIVFNFYAIWEAIQPKNQLTIYFNETILFQGEVELINKTLTFSSNYELNKFFNITLGNFSKNLKIQNSSIAYIENYNEKTKITFNFNGIFVNLLSVKGNGTQAITITPDTETRNWSIENMQVAQGEEIIIILKTSSEFNSEETQISNYMTNIFSLMKEFFDIKLGNVSIGAVIGLMLSIGVIGFVFKIWQGGQNGS